MHKGIFLVLFCLSSSFINCAVEQRPYMVDRIMHRIDDTTKLPLYFESVLTDIIKCIPIGEVSPQGDDAYASMQDLLVENSRLMVMQDICEVLNNRWKVSSQKWGLPESYKPNYERLACTLLRGCNSTLFKSENGLYVLNKDAFLDFVDLKILERMNLLKQQQIFLEQLTKTSKECQQQKSDCAWESFNDCVQQNIVDLKNRVSLAIDQERQQEFTRMLTVFMLSEKECLMQKQQQEFRTIFEDCMLSKKECLMQEQQQEFKAIVVKMCQAVKKQELSARRQIVREREHGCDEIKKQQQVELPAVMQRIINRQQQENEQLRHLAGVDQETIDRLQEKICKQDDQLTRLTDLEVALKEQNSSKILQLDLQNQKLSNAVSSMQGQTSVLNRRIDELSQELRARSDSLQQADGQVDLLHSQNQKLSNAVSSMRGQTSALNRRIDELSKELRARSDSLQQADGEVDLLHSRVQRLIDAVSSREEQMFSLYGQNQELGDTLSATQEENSSLNRQIGELSSQNQALLRKVQTRDALLQEANFGVQAWSREVCWLQRMVQELRSTVQRQRYEAQLRQQHVVSSAQMSTVERQMSGSAGHCGASVNSHLPQRQVNTRRPKLN